MIDLLLATNNSHKVAEIQAILNSPLYHLVMPQDVGIPNDFEVVESGQTFAENAELKAVAFGEQSHRLAIADDSGLVVTALGGRPGVLSKRYAPGSDADRNTQLLRELANQTDRTAAFVTVICLFDPVRHITHFFEGRVDGEIALKERGTAGFGYDPIFTPSGYAKTFGELGQIQKNTLSHRSKALEKLNQYLLKME